MQKLFTSELEELDDGLPFRIVSRCFITKGRVVKGYMYYLWNSVKNNFCLYHLVRTDEFDAKKKKKKNRVIYKMFSFICLHYIRIRQIKQNLNISTYFLGHKYVDYSSNQDVLAKYFCLVRHCLWLEKKNLERKTKFVFVKKLQDFQVS